MGHVVFLGGKTAVSENKQYSISPMSSTFLLIHPLLGNDLSETNMPGKPTGPYLFIHYIKLYISLSLVSRQFTNNKAQYNKSTQLSLLKLTVAITKFYNNIRY